VDEPDQRDHSGQRELGFEGIEAVTRFAPFLQTLGERGKVRLLRRLLEERPGPEESWSRGRLLAFDRRRQERER
jgi:hypothetical protein